jgi:hypothetical protein
VSASGRQSGGPGAGSPLGWLPAIVLCSAVGLLLCTVDETLSHATLDPPLSLYWLGLLLIGVPIFYRLTSEAASPGERLALVALLGLALYGVKIARDPLMFGYSDEPIHAYNASQIAEHGRLFFYNPLISVTPFYPGLEGATAALMSLTGLSSFGAGLIVVGAARVLLMLALFAIFLRLSGSARAAGLGAAVYVGSFNFLYFSAQYSYESLALPLFVAVLAAIAERSVAAREDVRSWAPPLLILIAGIVVVHHVTSYALVLTLVVLSLLFWRFRRDAPNPWPFAVATLGLTVTWLVVVASTTVGYLRPVFDRAFSQTIDTITGGQGPRALFESGGGGGASLVPTPAPAKAVALLAILILFAAAALGLRAIWPRPRREPFLFIFALAAIGFFASLLLRFVPAAWETGNRASGFFFIGLAFIVVCATLHPLVFRLTTRAFRVVITASLAIVLIGGVIAGWPWDLHLALPARATADGNQVVSEPLGLAEWAGGHLKGARFAAPQADARLLAVPGGETALTGGRPNVDSVIKSTEFLKGQLQILYSNNLRYVVADIRDRSDDAVRGARFSMHPPAAPQDVLRPFTSRLKFESVPGSTRIYDSGRIVVYDLEAQR